MPTTRGTGRSAAAVSGAGPADPVRRMPDGSYFFTRYTDRLAVSCDVRRYLEHKTASSGPWLRCKSARYGAGSPLYAHHTTSLVFNDPPLDTRVRKLIMGAHTRRAIADMEPGLIVRIDSLLDRIEARGGGDLIEDFASAIPVEIIGNLLGVPHAERGPLRAWSLAILGALEPVVSPAQQALGNRSVVEMLNYLRAPWSRCASGRPSAIRPSSNAPTPWI